MSEILWTELEKVDVLRERMGVSYERARFALEANQGDLVKALAELEKEHKEEDGASRWFIDGVKKQMKRLNKTQLNLKHEDKTLLSMSAPLGIALAYTIWKRPTLRMLGLIGAATAAVNHYELEVDSMEEQTEEVEEYDEYPYDIKTVIVPDDEFSENEKVEISE
ncbi:DUF4342 domain-containing protein [Desulfitobacterium metallireducens]|uniref:DUF4342 domain-containing protein n=1 Tax=Desulfitobacterium metallireducens DSM 15288 TaxID=871968 RepID=W0EEA3_9FIRM|nr:DUF4342 domain-containing protein [Desulfitobacterium metallireducens]AHF07843.1 hypothetical protein DESME_13045 [Desulfitobacterium metallireducens DSM 15288]